MRLWRISDYADLSGEGGRLFSARWHTQGRPIVYCAEHPAAALTEILVHLDWDLLPDSFQLLTIDIDDPVSLEQIESESLPPRWRTDVNATRARGDEWLARGSSLLLRVPSLIMPDVWNVLLNPSHPAAPSARIVKAEPFPLDGRLIGR